MATAMKINSKTTKDQLVSWLSRRGYKAKDLRGETKAVLFNTAKEVLAEKEKAKEIDRLKRGAPVRRKKKRKTTKKTTKKAAKKKTKKVHRRNTGSGRPPSSGTGNTRCSHYKDAWIYEDPHTGECYKIKVDGAHTSERGALETFRHIMKTVKSIKRVDLINQFAMQFGPKARWSAMNYISKAKKGKIKDCPRIREDDDKVLHPRRKKAKK